VDSVLAVNDPKAIALGLKTLMPLIPLDPRLEKALDQRIMALIDRGTAAKNAEMAEAIAMFLHRGAQEEASVARPYIPALLSFLAQNIETTGAYAYYTLMLVARDSPDYFGPHCDQLVRTLDSPSLAAKTFAMRIIAVLAPGHPEYVLGARDTLRNLAETSPSGLIKAEAANAYRAVREASKSSAGRSSRLPGDPAIASLYDTPVWRHAVESHLSTVYRCDAADVDRAHGRRKGVKRKIRPSKRTDLYQEFVEKLKQGECVPSFKEQLDLLSPEAMALAAPCEPEPAAAITPPPSPPLELSQPATNEPVVTARTAPGSSFRPWKSLFATARAKRPRRILPAGPRHDQRRR
jgi:hypothetical protein